MTRFQRYAQPSCCSAHEYPHVRRWASAIAERPAVKRGVIVNRTWGPPESQVPERHAAADIDAKLGQP